jgi:malonyl-CoA O-methyltransferase
VHHFSPAAYALAWIRANETPTGGICVHSGHANAYPEVTGYLVPTLLQYGERELATRLACWLLCIQRADGSYTSPDGVPYTFDTGQVLKGLLAVLPTLPEAEPAIRRGCEWLLTQIEPNGRITTPDKSAWRLPRGNLVSENIHLYALEPLRKAGECFNELCYVEAVERALAYYLAQPELTSFNTLSHFHAYVLEALVDLGYPDVAARGMAEVERLQRQDGSVPAYPDVEWVCSTGLAQYSVIWCKLGQREPAEKALDYLCRIQNPSGGFYGSYGRGANYFPNEEISWAVKFFLDAYHWHVPAAFDAEVTSFRDAIDES